MVDIKFNHLGNRIAATSIESSLKIFNIQQEGGLTLYKEISQASDVWKVEFNPNGNELLYGTLSMKVLDISSGEVTKEFGQSSKFIYAHSYSPNGLLCANGTVDGTVNLFDLRNYELKARFENHGKAVRCLEFNPSSTSLVSAGEDFHINITDMETLKRKTSLTGHSDWVTCISFNPRNPNQFITGSLVS